MSANHYVRIKRNSEDYYLTGLNYRHMINSIKIMAKDKDRKFNLIEVDGGYAVESIEGVGLTLALVKNQFKAKNQKLELLTKSEFDALNQEQHQNNQDQPRQHEAFYDMVVVDADELAIMDEFGEKIEALGAMMPPELRPVLVRYVETSVDTKYFTYAQKLAAANNIFCTRTRIGQDGFYYFVNKGNLQMSWGYGLLNKIARYMDKRNGGNGHVEFIEEIPTPEEIKKYSGGGVLVKLRLLSNSARNSHHEAVKQYQESFRAFVAITGDIKTAKKMTDELYPHVKNQVGVVGYGSAKTAPNGWTLHDQATKLAMKNLIKRNFNMPGRNDWPLITGGEIGNMSDEQYARFLIDNEEFVGHKKLSNDELNKVAESDMANKKSKEKVESATDDERQKLLKENVMAMRGSDEPID